MPLKTALSPDENLAPSIAIDFARETYSLDAIKKAGYRLLGKASIEIIDDPHRVTCVLHFPEPLSREQARSIMMEFRDEVLDQDLREHIWRETATIRNAILAYAFSRTGLQDEK